ncbi:MAG: hypothetical protein ABSH44_17785 [Bryobacteraceae bacterium]|jgi:hypothetical protein
MPDEFSIQISGIEETCAWLDTVPQYVVKGAVGKALTAACVPIFRALDARTPIMVDGSVKHDPPPGALKAHLKTDIAIDANGRGGKAQVGYGNLGYIARFLEYGHRLVAHGAKWSDRMRNYEGKLLGSGSVAANPFMRLAAAESSEAAIEAFGTSLQESMQAGIPGVKV